MATVNGTTGNDFIHVAGDGLTAPGGYTDNPGATSSADTIFSGNGGSDIIHAGAGDDSINFGTDLDGSDQIDGGDGNDTLVINGNVSVVFGANSLTSVENISIPHIFVQQGFLSEVNLTFTTANIPSGGLNIDASNIGASTELHVDTSAVTNLNLINITGGAGNDVIVDTNGNIDLSQGGEDTVSLIGGPGETIGQVEFGAALDPGDQVKQASFVELNGDYSAGLTLQATTLQNVGDLIFNSGHSYNITTNDGNVAAGQDMIVESSLHSTDSLTFNGAAELDGSFEFEVDGGTATITGGQKADDFDMPNSSGTWVLDGQGGDDFFSLFVLPAGTHLDGGSGNDTLLLGFDDGGAMAFNFSDYTIRNVEKIELDLGTDYHLTMDDATVAAYQTLTVDGSFLGTGTLNFDGTAETDGHFAILGGASNDSLGGGAQSDRFTPGAGEDGVNGGGGNDIIDMGANFDANDTLDGGDGNDSLLLDGDYSAGVVFSTTTLRNVEGIHLAAGHSYKLTTNDATVSAGQTLAVDGSALGAGDSLTLDGSAETDGKFDIKGGLGADTFTLSAANFNSGDTVNGGTGAALDEIKLTAAGTISSGALGNVSHIEELVLANGTNHVTLTDALVTSADDGHILTLVGGTGADTINATAVTTASDYVNYHLGSGNDVVGGGQETDTFVFAPSDLTGGDTISGGTGSAVDAIHFSTAGTLAASALGNVSHIEELVLANGTNHVTLTDALVTSADDGHIFTVIGGTGADTINATAVTTASDYVNYHLGSGNDVVGGGQETDTFVFAPSDLTGGDTISGGTGSAVDAIHFSTAGTIAASALGNVSHIEELVLANGTNSVSLNNAMVTSADDGHKLTVLGGTGSDTINASAVTTTTDAVSFHGGAGADVMTASAGTDTFVYAAATDSSSTGFDTIAGINFGVDRFDIPGAAGTVTGIDTALTTGALSTATFDANLASDLAGHLASHHAELFTPNSGTLSGQEFLVIDLNGTAGYQAGQDIVIHLTGATGTFAAGDFV